MRFTPTLFKHTEALLSELLRSTFPADLVVSRYFRQHRELGHSERGFVAETGATGFGARELTLTESGQRLRDNGLRWWASLSLLQRWWVIVRG